MYRKFLVSSLIVLLLCSSISISDEVNDKSDKGSILYVPYLSDLWVDDDFNSSTPGWNITHFDNIQDGIDAVAENGTVYVYNGTYYENLVVNKTICLIGENKNHTIIHLNTIDFYYGIQIVPSNVKITHISITAQQKNNINRDQVNLKQLLSSIDQRIGPIEIIRVEEGGDFTEVSHCNIFNINVISNTSNCTGMIIWLIFILMPKINMSIK